MSASPAHPAHAILVLAVGVAALFANLWLLSGPHLAGLPRVAALAGLSLLTVACLVRSFRLMTVSGPPAGDAARAPREAAPAVAGADLAPRHRPRLPERASP